MRSWFQEELLKYADRGRHSTPRAVFDATSCTIACPDNGAEHGKPGAWLGLLVLGVLFV